MIVTGITAAYGQPDKFIESIYPVGKLKPTDTVSKLKVGDPAPDFTLPAVAGGKISLGQYAGKHNVVISFVPAAWTPVCSDQWPGYNISRDLFEKYDAVLLGITVDNIPTLYSWIKQMSTPKEKIWFPVLSDFYPHGEVASRYGVLRSEGVSERALFVINKKGIIVYIDIHDINERPFLEDLAKALEEANKQ
ncbi:MAG: redoxin domain-containing protein [Desulfobacterium sp.]|nr:redoxin domain-containing protein [Desulfobacterium sp.]MBU3948290.1 redoxin domain-containing protein [Pseudomonadota bacterium]MBU4034958.1 redoxin domain-containing protein [Pseudomonadota bacterium]